MYKKKELIHWVRKLVNSQQVRDSIKRVLSNPDHRNFAAVLKLVLPYAIVSSIKDGDNWSLKLPAEEVNTEVTVND